jgi:uncharacterized protein (TIGR02646 family)
MIRINNKTNSAAPDILITKGAIETEKLKTGFDKGAMQFTFDPGIYGNKEVKEKLIQLQGYKCCFCEAKIGHISYGDVEHFRPKGGWVQNDEEINKPGYYWLAYEWENLLLSCQLCNQRYKKNYFPLINEAERALNHNFSISDELPEFIHPANDNPEEFIEFNENEPEAINDNIRGKATIKKLELNRLLLNEHRKKTLNMVKDIYDLARDFPDNPPHLKKAAKDKITRYKEHSQQDDTEYSSMLRCFFKKNPINF